MKKFEILLELPKCDTETRSEHMLLAFLARKLSELPGFDQYLSAKCWVFALFSVQSTGILLKLL
jgi:hypothetical protein